MIDSTTNLKRVFYNMLQNFAELSFELGFPGASVVKNLLASVGDARLISGSRRSLGEGNGYLFQYSCLGNPMGRGASQATIHGVAKESDMTYRLNSNNSF